MDEMHKNNEQRHKDNTDQILLNITQLPTSEQVKQLSDKVDQLGVKCPCFNFLAFCFVCFFHSRDYTIIALVIFDLS